MASADMSINDHVSCDRSDAWRVVHVTEMKGTLWQMECTPGLEKRVKARAVNTGAGYPEILIDHGAEVETERRETIFNALRRARNMS